MTTQLAIIDPSTTQITPYNYRPTKKLSALISLHGLVAVKAEMLRLLVELFEASEFEQIPTNKVALDLIISMVIHRYPSMEIGEFSLLLREGITGGYGPLYGKITIDTIGVWCQKYYEITWKNIEAQATQRNISQPQTVSGPAVPPPPYITEQIQALEKKVLHKRRPYSDRRPAPQPYLSIKDYCFRHNIPYADHLLTLEDQWISKLPKEEKIDVKEYLKAMASAYLNELNKKLGY
jgi:hypothetical protein